LPTRPLIVAHRALALLLGALAIPGQGGSVHREGVQVIQYVHPEDLAPDAPLAVPLAAATLFGSAQDPVLEPPVLEFAYLAVEARPAPMYGPYAAGSGRLAGEEALHAFEEAFAARGVLGDVLPE
jgi:hypothetical protein